MKALSFPKRSENPDRENLFAVIRALGTRADGYRESAQRLTPPGMMISIGGADFDEVLKAGIIEDYLRAIRHGKPPDEARAYAAAARTAAVRKWNARRPKGCPIMGTQPCAMRRPTTTSSKTCTSR